MDKLLAIAAYVLQFEDPPTNLVVLSWTVTVAIALWHGKFYLDVRSERKEAADTIASLNRILLEKVEAGSVADSRFMERMLEVIGNNTVGLNGVKEALEALIDRDELRTRVSELEKQAVKRPTERR